MKSIIAIALALVASFAFAQAGPSQSSSDIPNREVLHLFDNATRVEQLVQTIESQFDLAKANLHLQTLPQVITEIKQVKLASDLVLEEIQTYIESDHLYTFWERLVANYISIELRYHEQALDSIAWEILGQQNGISNFYQRQYSEPLRTTINLVDYRTAHTKSDLIDGDKLIKEEFQGFINGTKLEAVKKQVNVHLDTIVKYVNEARGELIGVYIAEIEKIHYNKVQLDRIQKMKVDRLLDAFYFTVQFIEDYRRILNRIAVVN